MKYLTFLFFILIPAGLVHAQILTIIDQESGLPLEMVTIASAAPKAFVITNSEGQADITPFKNSETIEMRLIGYQTQTFSYQKLEEQQWLVELVQTSITLDQVVVSASRWNQDEREIPAKILIISPRDAALENPQTTADLLATSGEVFIQKSQQGGGSPMIRGFSTNRLLYTVDGIRMNTAIFRSGNLQNVISLDPFSFESTEVIFGPVSLIYGSDAIGGVMGFRTLTPSYSLTDKPLISGHGVVRYATANNEITGHFDVNVGWKKFAFITSISSNRYDNLKMGSYGPEDYLRPWFVERIDSSDVVVTNPNPEIQNPTGYSQINLMQKFSYKPSATWELQYGFHYSSTTRIDRYDRLIRTKNGLPRSAEWVYGPQEWMMNNLIVTNEGNNVLYDQMTLRFAWQRFGESRHDRDFQKVIRYNRVEQVDALSANADFIKTLGDRHTFFYGLEWVWDKVASNGSDENIQTGVVSPGPSRYPNATWASYAAYLSYHFRISPKWLLQTGARYNFFSMKADFTNNLPYYPLPFSEVTVNNGALTGNLGFVYNPDKNWSLVMNLSSGYRAPNVDDMGKVFDSEPGSVVVPNPDLNPEYAYNGELGVAKVFGEFARVDLTGYFTYLQNAMVRRDYTLNGLDSIIYDGQMSRVQAIQNAAFATVYGIQASVEFKLPAGFGLTGQFNYQKGEEEMDDGSKSTLRHAAPMFGVAHLTYKMSKLELDLYTIFNGSITYQNLPLEERGKAYLYASDANGNPWSPSWYTLNFKALYQLTKHIALSAGVENMTDQRYRPYSSGIAGPGRNFIMALRARF